MQLEAPITRVIELLTTAVTETINPETAMLINQVRSAYIKRDAAIERLRPRQTSMSDLRFSGNRYLEDYGTLRAAFQRTHGSRHAGAHRRVARRKNLLCPILPRSSSAKEREISQREGIVRCTLKFLALYLRTASYIRFVLDSQTPRLSKWDDERSPADLARLAAIRATALVNDVCKPIKVHASAEIKTILKKSLDWDFKIFELELLTERR